MNYISNLLGVSTSTVLTFCALFAVSAILVIIFRILLVLAVQKDCEIIGVKHKAGWGVLVFFIPWTVAIYYLIRKSDNIKKVTPKYCYSCGTTSAPNSKFCQNCGSANVENMVVNNVDDKKKKRKSLLISTIVFFVVANVFNVFLSNYTLTSFYQYALNGKADRVIDYFIDEFDDDDDEYYYDEDDDDNSYNDFYSFGSDENDGYYYGYDNSTGDFSD